MDLKRSLLVLYPSALSPETLFAEDTLAWSSGGEGRINCGKL